MFQKIGRDFLITFWGLTKSFLKNVNLPDKEIIMMMECRQFIRTPHKNIGNHRELGTNLVYLNTVKYLRLCT